MTERYVAAGAARLSHKSGIALRGMSDVAA
jgi:hypothetical protein